MRLRLFGYRLLAQRVDAEDRVGGIVVPPDVKTFPAQGIVVGVGDGRGEKESESVVSVVSGQSLLGKQIMYWADQVSVVYVDGAQYDLLHVSKVIGVFEGSE